jgi:hypothetical protein
MGGKMENEDLDQYQDTQNPEVIDPKIQVSRDGKWIIIRLNLDGKKANVIKPVAYFERIIERARGSAEGTDYHTQEIEG